MEAVLAKKVNFDAVIKNFARKKPRKVPLFITKNNFYIIYVQLLKSFLFCILMINYVYIYMLSFYNFF